jgi:predicted nucleotidyltransferase
MPGKPQNDPLLKRFRAALEEIYGNRHVRVVLFGSRARGDARPDSDYDVAVFLTPLGDRWKELDRLADLRLRFLDETKAFFDAVPYDASAYRERSPLMHEVRHEGLDL